MLGELFFNDKIVCIYCSISRDGCDSDFFALESEQVCQWVFLR